ncbi:hypothetical protein BC936DRAFT_139150 [Jimgerdemannia flammicorona]|uniref:DnaJ homologue subfamily C member 28 conserved domain-containing protein n=1 Tax=Jimgerdemannia flammicorona TaxID=994334 RepID=A0A433BAJ8_9FUNG|nr:hypothetical protein BC936DRAFT_139150 [Jimgerdemannia flammicorona]
MLRTSNQDSPPPSRTRLVFPTDTPEETQRSRATPTANDPPWTGEEHVQDTILRMLVDKYNKPLRVEGAARQAIPRPTPLHPVDLNFHANTTPDDSAEISSAKKAREREARVRSRLQNRLSSARDRAFDYRSGVVAGGDSGRDVAGVEVAELEVENDSTRPTMTKDTLPNFTPMDLRRPVDIQIEAARARGDFDNLPGRGKPLPVDAQINNPFIDTTEYLMNRLVQRQGAAPAWVEMQNEVDREVNAFRKELSTGWRKLVNGEGEGDGKVGRRAREDWKEGQKAYVNAAVRMLNGKIRSYNVFCPSVVQKPYLSVEEELSRVCEVREKDKHAL